MTTTTASTPPPIPTTGSPLPMPTPPFAPPFGTGIRLMGMIKWDKVTEPTTHRDYHVWWKVSTDNPSNGPNTIEAGALAAGMPPVGSVWALGTDVDDWAFCWPNFETTPVVESEQNVVWVIKQTFSTKPLNRCLILSFTDPTLEPPRVTGDFIAYTREIDYDFNDTPITTSAGEPMYGDARQRDDSKFSVVITINAGSLPLAQLAQQINTLNDSTLWGIPARCIKLSTINFIRQLYGICTYYYTLTYRFDVDWSTFDRSYPDYGTQILAPGGTLGNLTQMKSMRDAEGNPISGYLDGSGNYADKIHAGTRTFQYYGQSNFLLLGIPTAI